MRSLIGIISIISCFLIGCVDEIDIPLSGESTLTIEGLITDEPGLHKVQLSYSYSFNDNPSFVASNPLIFGAQVEIKDDDNNTIVMLEGENGTYYAPYGFAGVVGRTYTLKVILNNGEVYFSQPEKLEPIGAVIKEVCFDNTIEEVSTGENIKRNNTISFYVNFTEDGSNQNFYRWGYQSVYEVEAPLADVSPPCNKMEDPDCIEPTKRCWATKFDSEFLKVDSDALYNGKTVDKYMIYSTPFDRQFNIIYAGHIELFSLSKPAYEYWSAIESQLGNNATIFETPNYQIRGNIVAEDQTDRLVLGYFGASSVSRARIIVDNSELNGNAGPIDCTPDNNGEIPEVCIDCRFWPASDVKPDYWPR